MTGGLTPKAAPNYPWSYCVRGKRGLQPLPPFPAFVAVLGHTELAPSWFPALFYVFLPGPGLLGHLEMFSSWPWPRGVQEPRLITNLWFSWVPLQMGTQVRNDLASFHQLPHPATRPIFFLLPSCSGVSFQFLFFLLLSSPNPCFKSKLMGGLSFAKAVFGFPSPVLFCAEILIAKRVTSSFL